MRRQERGTGRAAAPKLLVQIAVVVDVGVEYGVNERLHSRERLVDAKAVHTVRNERLEGAGVSGRQRQRRAASTLVALTCRMCSVSSASAPPSE